MTETCQTCNVPTAVKERPILFSGPMVRAILSGQKTQTRRMVKCLGGIRRGDQWSGPANPASGHLVYRDGAAWDDDREFPRSAPIAKCPYGSVGDRLWVRETWSPAEPGPLRESMAIAYAVDFAGVNDGVVRKWRPSIHMPRWASRITLEITGIRVERLNDISEEDAKAEGVEPTVPIYGDNGGYVHEGGKEAFMKLWESINGRDSWTANPWVWVVEFRYLPGGRF